jgi:MFS family permease
LRLALLPHHPVPAPDVYDEFSHLLVADTLRHFRLANPPHALPQFFETFFVLQEPTYSSIYPIGQGLALAFGWMVFGLPWAGVILSVSAFCALCYWMLRAWTTPGWALVGGLLAAFQFGPLNPWMNNYWGGAFPAAAGCLVFGALPRLRARGRARDGALLGAGLGMHLLSRPYESIFLAIGVVLFFCPILRQPDVRRKLARSFAAAVAVVLPAIAITLLQNKQVTGNWTTLPEALSQYQYGVPAALTFQASPVPHRELTPQQELDYKMQQSFQGDRPETLKSYLERLVYRVRFYRFFFYVPLYLALPVFLNAIGEFRFFWVLLAISAFALGINFFPAFQFHYLAAVTCLFVLVAVTALERLSKWSLAGFSWGREAAALIVVLCAAHFIFWYGLHVFDSEEWSLAMRRYETWDTINHRNPERRIAAGRQLAQIPGKLLVFVRYWPQHIFQDEWVWNAADIDQARIVMARDLGPAEDEKLIRYYPDRAVWLLEPDSPPFRLIPYQPRQNVPLPDQPRQTGPTPNQSPQNVFENPGPGENN